jgi:hypothetical protein
MRLALAELHGCLLSLARSREGALVLPSQVIIEKKLLTARVLGSVSASLAKFLSRQPCIEAMSMAQSQFCSVCKTFPQAFWPITMLLLSIHESSDDI